MLRLVFLSRSLCGSHDSTSGWLHRVYQKTKEKSEMPPGKRFFFGGLTRKRVGK